jgi:bifunctional non-homologous end joining protein LigD
MPLLEYRRKRRFTVTPEPKGASGPSGRDHDLAYVIQKHRATALHYDLRLEWDGVMLSWAVPKGPSLDPSVKRMAMQVEDHPIGYNSFEGTIPAGEYGGGTVMIWDRGTWHPQDANPGRALEKGTLRFSLAGDKLQGDWVLIRTKVRPGQKRTPWLLIKRRDQWADSRNLTELAPRSVVSNRLLVEIARDGGGDTTKAAEGDPLRSSEVGRPKGRRPPKNRKNRSRHATSASVSASDVAPRVRH